MKLKNIELNLVCPSNIGIKNLRNFITSDLCKEGELIRWSINKIEYLNELNSRKLIQVNALILT